MKEPVAHKEPVADEAPSQSPRVRPSGGGDEPWTILRLLEWTTELFKTRGFDSPRLDAEVLLAHARECSRVDLYAAFNQQPDEEVRTALRELVRRRATGTPVAQLVGYREFYSMRFRVNETTLIPRPETEHVVVESLDRLKDMRVEHRPLQVADIGTGSGCIAISIARHDPGAEVTAVDISNDPLEIAQWNADALGVEDRIRFMRSDLLESVEQPEQFDLVVSNPPYVSEEEWQGLDPGVKDHEPRAALVAEENGTAIIKRLLHQTVHRVRCGGQMVIELSPMIADACVQFAHQTDHFDDVRLLKDLAGHARVLSVRKSTEG